MPLAQAAPLAKAMPLAQAAPLAQAMPPTRAAPRPALGLATTPAASFAPPRVGNATALVGEAMASVFSGQNGIRPIALDLAARVGGNVANVAAPEGTPAPHTPPSTPVTPAAAEPAPRLGELTLAGEADFVGDLDAPGAPARELSSSEATARTAASPGRAAAPPQLPSMQIAARISRGVEEGLKRINVRLHPAELGRVDIKLDVGFDGRVLAVITAERADTLELLQRDARLLERALAEVGLDTGSGGLNFGLRQDDSDAFAGGGGNGGGEEQLPEEPTITSNADDGRPHSDRLIDINV